MKKKLWIWIIVALFALLLAWRWLADKREDLKDGRDGPQAVAGETARVERVDLADAVFFSGNLKAAQSYILAPRVAGQLASLNVNIGDPVSRGQVIAQIDDVLIRQELDKAEANLEQAASSLAEAAKNLEHSRLLLAQDYISQADFDLASAQYSSELAKHRVAQASRNSARIQLDHTRVTADWDGGGKQRVIGERFAEPGQLLSVGAPVVSVLDISTLVAEIDVIESDYTRFKIGQPATIYSDAWPGESFSGRVARVAPQLSEQSRQARVEIEVANPALRLKPGMYARVQITFQTELQVTAVPSAALYKYKGQEGVWLVDKASSSVSFVPVEKGISTSEYVQIVSPDLQGEVVTLGQDQLDDGRKVILPGAKPASAGKAGRKK